MRYRHRSSQILRSSESVYALNSFFSTTKNGDYTTDDKKKQETIYSTSRLYSKLS